MPEPPGSGTLADQLTALRRRIDELTRRPPELPACRIRLAVDLAQPSGDLAAGPGWVVFEDDYGLFTPGDPCYLTIKTDGYYSVNLHSCAQGPTTGQHGAKVHVGPALVDSRATDLSPFGASGEGAVCDAYRARFYLAASTKLYWTTYAAPAATLRALSFSVPTEITLQYVSSR